MCVKGRAAPAVVVEVAVAATERCLILALLLTLSCTLQAAVLPEERADVMFHRYDGGGVEVDGPSILVRKSIGQSVSVNANYLVDSISCASVDVVTSASPYTEERTETSLSVDYLYDKTLMTLSFTKSDESDYLAETSSFDISHDMFGDLTTVSLGYSVGNDNISSNVDETFNRKAKRQNFRAGITQILTKNSLLSVNLETITDEGILRSPYRSVRYLDSGTETWVSEIYPETRTSNALALRFKYFLPYRAALSGEYRYFDDTWGIDAYNVKIGYTHPFKENWIFDVHYRYYTQTKADFYSDLFVGQMTLMARDKELSTFQDHTIGVGVSYEFKPEKWQFIDHGSFNFEFDYIRFD
jgi:opacity protein-like surface antigen